MTNRLPTSCAVRFAPVLALVAASLSCATPRNPAAPAPATTQPVATPRDLPGLPNFARVSPLLYRGGQPDAAGFRRLGAIGVKTIVDLRGAGHLDDLDGTGLKYFHIPSSASNVELAKIKAFLRVVNDPANQPVFVHCRRGADRTGAYVGAYRMIEQGWTVRDAEVELRRFHFFPLWQAIPEFLERLDPERVRREVGRPTTRRATTRRG